MTYTVDIFQKARVGVYVKIFGPSIDGYAQNPFLPCSPRELLHNGNDKPVILGNTSYEYMKFFSGITSARNKLLNSRRLNKSSSII